MKKKVLIVIAIFTFLASLSGVTYLIDGIQSRGAFGINYGRVAFPLIICILATVACFKKKS